MPAAAPARRDEAAKLAYREFATSALYMALVLLAVLAALPEDRLPEGWAVLGVLLGTAIGLILAHWVAFRLAAQLAEETGVSPAEAAREAGAQLAGGILVAVIAAVPLALLPGPAAVTVSLVLLSALPALAGVAIGRLRGRSWARSLLAGLLVLAIALVVVTIKALLAGH